MEYPNIADGDSVAHEVQVDLHVLCPLVLDGVGGEIHGADVVAVDERNSWRAGCRAPPRAIVARTPPPRR